MRVLFAAIIAFFISLTAQSQDSITIKIRNQYKAEVKTATIVIGSNTYEVNKEGNITIPMIDSFSVTAKDHTSKTFLTKDADTENTFFLHKNFTWKDLLTPMFYIVMGGIWFILFVVFAETGLFAGFFLPGDSLLFVTGIYSNDLVHSGLKITGTGSLMNLLILGVLISIAGILGNFVGYWFGRKSGNYLFQRKDTFLFKKKYLYQAKDFYDKHGGGAIVFARFLPIIRTFAPIIAGIVKMDYKKFTYYNIVGCVAWVFTMLLAGHYLQQFFLHYYKFDLREHLEVIVIGIVLVSTAPILIKLFFGKKKSTENS